MGKLQKECCTNKKISNTVSKVIIGNNGIDILENTKRKFALAKDYVEDNAIRATNTGIKQSDVSIAPWLQSLNSLAENSVANYSLIELAQKFVDGYTIFLRQYSRENQSPAISLLFLNWIDFLKANSDNAFKRHVLTCSVANAEYARLTSDPSYLKKALSFIEIGLNSSSVYQPALLSVKALILSDIARRTDELEEASKLYESALQIYQKIALIESTDHKKL